MMQLVSPSKDLIEQTFQIDDDSLLAAMAAAFALVACSDSVLEHCETTRFFEIIQTTESLSKLPWKNVERKFQSISEGILNEGTIGRNEALSHISKIKSNNAYRDTVISCAQIAVISNFQIQATEETALGDICTALGLNPNDY